jgi:biotin carboxylase
MGWEVIVADGNKEAEGKRFADRFEHIDLKDRSGLVAAVKRYQREGRVDGVFTTGTDFSATVALIARECGLPGIPYETALNATDKGRMRRIFRERGVPQPDFVELKEGDDPFDALKTLSFPLVVKPVDNMGARGVRRIDTGEELTQALPLAIGNSSSRRVIVEEYMEGPEFSLDALVVDGTPTLCGIADRHIFFEPSFVEMGHTIPSDKDGRVQEAVIAVFFQGIRALGLDYGAAKGDVKFSSRGPLVGEIAARLSGGYMSGWTYPYSSGVNVTAAALRIAVGQKLPDLAPIENAVSAERAFISIPGIIDSLHGIREAGQGALVKDLFVRVDAGSEVTFPVNNLQKCGNVITKGSSRSEAVRAAEAAIAHVFLRLKPDQDETTEFLFGNTFPHISAFRLTLPDNRRRLVEMPPWIGDPFKYVADEPKIISLPRFFEEPLRDWHAMEPGRLCAVITRFTGAEFIDGFSASGFILGSLFWKAFLKASAQGAVYLLDTIKSLRPNPGELNLFLKKGIV